MLARSHTINARVSALEAYVGLPKEHTSMTITSRLEAQHSLLLALRADHNDLRTEMRERFAKVEGRLIKVEGRLTGIEDAIGKVLWGLTEIKKRLPDDPP
jgi:hypothetical protein